MKKEYVKPEMVVEQFVSEICLQGTSSGGNIDNENEGGSDEFSNDRRGGWGDLWN